MLHVARACGGPDGLAGVPTVFAARHGECAGGVELMRTLALGNTLTAGGFSHSVHNTAAGLFSIINNNPTPSTSISGGPNSFAAGMVEAIGMLHRLTTDHVLLVVGDAPLPEIFADFSPDSTVGYAVAFLLGRDAHGGGIRLALDGATTATTTPWPDAVEFLRWTLSSERSVSIGRARSRTRWTRSH
jgi:hypothetical protein